MGHALCRLTGARSLAFARAIRCRACCSAARTQSAWPQSCMLGPPPRHRPAAACTRLQTMAALKGRCIDASTLEAGLLAVQQDVQISPDAPGEEGHGTPQQLGSESRTRARMPGWPLRPHTIYAHTAHS